MKSQKKIETLMLGHSPTVKGRQVPSAEKKTPSYKKERRLQEGDYQEVLSSLRFLISFIRNFKSINVLIDVSMADQKLLIPE